METSITFEETFPTLPKLETIKSTWGELKKFPDRVRMLLKVLPNSIRGIEERHLETGFIKKLQDVTDLAEVPNKIEFHRSCIALLSFLTERKKRSIERGLASFILRTYHLQNIKPHSKGWIIYGKKGYPSKPNGKPSAKNQNPEDTNNNNNNSNKNNNNNNGNNNRRAKKKKKTIVTNIRKRKTLFTERPNSTGSVDLEQKKITNYQKKKKKNEKTNNYQIRNKTISSNIKKKNNEEKIRKTNKRLNNQNFTTTNQNLNLIPTQPNQENVPNLNTYPQQNATIYIEFFPKKKTDENSWLRDIEQMFPSVWD
ncbi:hypothetical protein M0812_18710 [Anaeramoeba flamelloides]|uniref:Uncharacterized protein n=1 Tax=Anaeramoeba flamelloides TaxID=1746091 RepID=A0AAV7Z4B1_9EUKA|nr:hypothetical protein M0812_18710 [Anaeramoeba flamelloides]